MGEIWGRKEFQSRQMGAGEVAGKPGGLVAQSTRQLELSRRKSW